MVEERLVFSILRICVLSFALLSVVTARGQATDPAQTHLGKVYFPTSCSADAQPLLEKGLALLHSFQYMEARQTFEEAETRDAKCAMAHWGKAMSLYEQLWESPDEKQRKEGQKEIALAQDTSGAQTYYAKLAEDCPGGDRPELTEARTVLAKK
jgi:hypothetical protein